MFLSVLYSLRDDLMLSLVPIKACYFNRKLTDGMTVKVTDDNEHDYKNKKHLYVFIVLD